MPSSYSSKLRIELIATGEQDGTWGASANVLFQRLEDAIAGWVSIAMSDANYTLTANNGSEDEARNAFVRLTGALTATRNITVPTAEKWWFIHNATSGSQDIVVKTAAGTGVTVPNGKKRIVHCDGTNVEDAFTDLPTATSLGGVSIVTTSGAQTLTNKTITIDDDKFTLQDGADTTKKLVLQLSGITTATTRTWTIPDASLTVVGEATTQTLTNKTLDVSNTVTLRDDRFTLQDSGDVTKQLVLQLSGITTATTRTIAVPDANLTLVGLDTTQSLTNKTLDNSNTVTFRDDRFTLQDSGDTTKQVVLQLSGLTTATTRTITVPDANFTIVGLDTTQSLTNKTLDNTNTITVRDDRFTLQDSGDTSKQVVLQLSGLTTSTTRTITVPDSSGTLLYTDGSGASLTGVKKPGKETIWIPASAMLPNITNGPSAGTTETTTNKVMVRTLDYDQTTSESAQFSIAFPKSWDEGTVTFVPFWTASTGTGTFITSVSAVAVSNDDVADAAFGTAQTSTDTLLATGDIHVGPESSAITIAGSPAEGDIVFFKVSRDISDTLTGDAKLVGIKLHFTTNASDDT